MTVSISDYDADPSASRLSTDAIQAAIDAVASAGGGTATVPPGTYLFGTVTLRSNIELHLEPGAMLLASPNINDFVNEPQGVAPPEFETAYCPFVGIDIEDVSVTGTGAIDFRGRDYNHYETPLYGELFTAKAHAAMPERRRNEFAGVPGRPRPAFMFFFLRCRNLRFSDLTIRDAACWTFRFSLCDTVRLRGLNIQNDLRAINSDGINIGSSSNITVSDCTIAAGDDCIAMVNYLEDGGTCSNVTITNCVLVSYSCGVRIGYKGRGAVERVAISNCVITGSNRGIGIFAGEGSRVSDVVVSNLVIETHLIAGHWWGKGEPLAFLIIDDDGVIENVSAVGLTVRAEQGIVIYNDMKSTIRNITLDAIRMELRSSEMARFTGGTIDLQPRELIRRKMPPLLIHGAENVRVRDLDVRFHESAGDYFDHEVCVEDSENVVILNGPES